MEKSNMTIKEAAVIMEKSQQFVRTALQQGLFGFGVAVKMSSVYTYYINRKKFYAYMGIERNEQTL